MYGWAGTILRVDLTSGKIEKEPLSEELGRNYIGGRGINIKLLYEGVKPGTNGLAPENVLIFGAGPVTGTSLPSGRLNITAMSPLTGILGDSNAGSHFSPELKFAGYDHIVFTGKAPQPVYLWIDDDRVEIRDARHLWGKMSADTDRLIKEEIGDSRIQTSCIGPAGEKLIKFASVTVGKDGACGKCGLGAVMGSKNLKAVAVRGTGGVRVPDPAAFSALARNLRQAVMQEPRYSSLSTYGTPYLYTNRHKVGGLALRDGQESGSFPGFEKISDEALHRDYVVKKKACFGCNVHCRSFFEIKDGPYAGVSGVGIELSVQEAWGSLVGISYAPALYKAFDLCNQYGMDSTECGQIVGAAIEWYEKGLISKQDLNGVELAWGDHKSMMELTRMIGERQGIGDLLAEGAVLAAEKLGKDASKCITHSKGASRTNVDVRLMTAYSFGLAVSSRGADHLRGSAAGFGAPGQYEGVPMAVYNNGITCTLADSLGLCKFHTTYLRMKINLKDMVEIFKLTTGLEVDEQVLRTSADRIWTTERAFIVREGITRKDDYLVGRYMDEPVRGGPHDGLAFDREKWDKMLDEYYEIVGWNKDGIPTRATLERLGLQSVADELETLGKLRD
ncbi:MAG: aldehyde ferredoxin oxidoreductase family protein [Chloroflexi bacterium]|nr:aldehyde ferredoxin oxidoreductase family protein [Chloroflexota bacterium]